MKVSWTAPNQLRRAEWYVVVWVHSSGNGYLREDGGKTVLLRATQFTGISLITQRSAVKCFPNRCRLVEIFLHSQVFFLQTFAIREALLEIKNRPQYLEEVLELVKEVCHKIFLILYRLLTVCCGTDSGFSKAVCVYTCLVPSSRKSARFAELMHENTAWQHCMTTLHDNTRVRIKVWTLLRVSRLCDHQTADDHRSEKLQVTHKLRFLPVCSHN